MSGQHYCLRWNNYQSNMTSVFHQLLQTESFVDVTLSCNDSSVKAHKVVLSACSSYFQKLLIQNPCNHPTIIMPPDVSFNDLKVIVDFVYRGEIDVDQAQLQSLLKTADQLKIKGLCEVPDSKESANEGEGTSAPPSNFRTNINLFGSDYQQQPPQQQQQQHSQTSNQNVRTFNFDNVVHPAVNIRNSYLSSELSLNQLPRIKQSTSPPPLYANESFVASSAVTKALYANSGSDNLNQNVKRPSAKRRQSPPSTAAGTSSGISGGRTSPSPKRKLSIEVKRPLFKDRAVQSDSGESGMNLQHENGLDQSHGIHVRSSPGIQAGSISDPVRHEPQVWRWIQSNGERVPECITVATSTEEDQKNVPVVILERSMGTMPMIVHNLPTALSPQIVVEGSNSNNSVQSTGDHTPPEVDIPPEAQPPAPSATLVENLDLSEHHEPEPEPDEEDSDHVKVKFETLRSVDQSGDTVDIDSHMSERNQEESDHSMQTMMITPELLGLLPSSSGNSDGGDSDLKGSKGWTQDDMEMALDALRNHNMSLTKASSTYGIPSTTLWQRAHRLGIDTPKKEGNTKNWTEDNLNNALEALRTGTISANKASKAFGIPSSTLYKIARREGIRLAAPFNAAPTTWTQDDLERALESIRSGQASVQRASTEFGIPTGTLYGRCKREGIELSRSNPTPWSEDAMGEALEAVRVGQMSINQAAIHYNLPYSSLYGRFKRGKFDTDDSNNSNGEAPGNQMMLVNYQQEMHPYHPHPGS